MNDPTTVHPSATSRRLETAMGCIYRAMVHRANGELFAAALQTREAAKQLDQLSLLFRAQAQAHDAEAAAQRIRGFDS